jgi:hypothetical protein
VTAEHYPRVTRRGAYLDWVKFDALLARDGSVDPVDKALYAAIASFADTDTRETPGTGGLEPGCPLPHDVPTRRRLAECIGRSVDTVDRATRRLEERGLLRVHRQADPGNPRRMLPSEYELLDHELWDERAAERAARRRAAREGGRTDAAAPGRARAATLRRTDAATPGRTGAAVKDQEEKREEETPSIPPSSTARERLDGGKEGAGAGTSMGVSLLMAVGAEHPQLAVGGQALADLGARLDLLLAAGWEPAALRAALTGGLPPRITAPAGFLARRIAHIPPIPVTLPAPAITLEDETTHGETFTPPPFGRHLPPPALAECEECGVPPVPGHNRCPQCLGWPLCTGCGLRRANPAGDGLCRPCRDDFAERHAAEHALTPALET